MKALRRSIKGEKATKPHNSIAPKSADAIIPPLKIIQATRDYRAQSDQDMSFEKGEFFHVIGRENDPDYYMACNPMVPDARGLVPVGLFKVIGRTERDNAPYQSQPPSQPQPQSQPQPTSQRDSKTGGNKFHPMVGIVMYDFERQRPDELTAKAGDKLVVIAQSDPAWFLAKPIDQLGGPGLIPVSYVEVRDISYTPVSDPQEAVRRAGIPRVEEWKKMAADYKNSSITLGKFEAGGGGGRAQQDMEQAMDRMSLQDSQASARASQNGYAQASAYSSQRNTQQDMMQRASQGAYNRKSASPLLPAPNWAYITQYCYAEEKYWFVIVVTYGDAYSLRTWKLSRYYEDFYDFQIALLRQFPVEAGNGGTSTRTLPYIPGPVRVVSDLITAGRLPNLNVYMDALLKMDAHISRCDLVRQFFSPRPGDYEIEAIADMEQVMPQGPGPQPQPQQQQQQQQQQPAASALPNGSGGGAYADPPQQPAMARQPSSLSQPSQSSLSPGADQQQPVQNIKIKVKFDNELIAMLVPADIDFDVLFNKIGKRLGISVANEMHLSYKDDADGLLKPLAGNDDLDSAIDGNRTKLLIYVSIS